MSNVKAPQAIIDSYMSIKKQINILYNEMNDIYSDINTIKAKQKEYLNKEKELSENMYGRFIPYVFIDQHGNHSIKNRKVSNGAWEQYRNYLESLC